MMASLLPATAKMVYQTRLGPERVASSSWASTSTHRLNTKMAAAISATISATATTTATGASMDTSCSTLPGAYCSTPATPSCSLSSSAEGQQLRAITDIAISAVAMATVDRGVARLHVVASRDISCSTHRGAFCSKLATPSCSHDATDSASAPASVDSAVEPKGRHHATFSEPMLTIEGNDTTIAMDEVVTGDVAITVANAAFIGIAAIITTAAIAGLCS